MDVVILGHTVHARDTVVFEATPAVQGFSPIPA